MMNESVQPTFKYAQPPVKKPNGCWWFSGCLLTVMSVCFILFTIFLILDSEEKMDANRAEYSASFKEYEEALMAYEADSANLQAQYRRIEAEIDAALLRNDSALAAVLEDSLHIYAEPVFKSRGHIGFNIAGAFYMIFIVFMLIPLAIGIALLLYYRRKKRKYERGKNEELRMKN